MGAGYLADTNVIIDYLGNKLPQKASVMIDDLEIKLSVISRIELLSWRNPDEEQLAMLSSFIDATEIFDLSEPVIQKVIEIRKAHRIKLPDVIIASTAFVHDLTLITRNVSDFKGIEGLSLMNPWD